MWKEVAAVDAVLLFLRILPEGPKLLSNTQRKGIGYMIKYVLLRLISECIND